MEVDRKGNKLTIQLDTAAEAIGLFAVLRGDTNNIRPDVIQSGQWLYNWFYTQVQKLYLDYERERSVASMSAETLSRPEVVNTPSKRAKKR